MTPELYLSWTRICARLWCQLTLTQIMFVVSVLELEEPR